MGLVYLYTLYIHKKKSTSICFFPMMSEMISREGEIPVGSKIGILTDICPQKSSIHGSVNIPFVPWILWILLLLDLGSANLKNFTPLRIPKDPPMEGWMNLFFTGVYIGPQNGHFWGVRILGLAQEQKKIFKKPLEMDRISHMFWWLQLWFSYIYIYYIYNYILYIYIYIIPNTQWSWYICLHLPPKLPKYS